MYTFDMSTRFLDTEERQLFTDYLTYYELDENIWNVFECYFQSAKKGTIPLVVRVYDDAGICGAAFITKCQRYGKVLFDGKRMISLLNFIGLPCYLWMKGGCCMDSVSNPGFSVVPSSADEIHSLIAEYLKNKHLLTLIYDYSDNEELYNGALKLNAMAEGLIGCSDMTELHDYLKLHKSIKQKLNKFANNGGTFELVPNHLPENDIEVLQRLYETTASRSIIYAPYQEIYLKSAETTCRMNLNGVYYFIVRLNGEFLGYQEAIMTGRHLNLVFGFFDRDRKTTFHAYEVIIVNLVQFALDHHLTVIDLGPMNNVTKERMATTRVEISYFIYSRFHFLQSLFELFFKKTKIQGEKQLQHQ